MGSISVPGGNNLLITPVDRTTAANAGAGMTPQSEQIILFGDSAGNGLNARNVIAIGAGSAGGNGAGWGGITLPAPELNSILVGRLAGGALTSDASTHLIILGHDSTVTDGNANATVIGHGIDLASSLYDASNSIVISSVGLQNVPGVLYDITGSIIFAAGNINDPAAIGVPSNSIFFGVNNAIVLANANVFTWANAIDESATGSFTVGTAGLNYSGTDGGGYNINFSEFAATMNGPNCKLIIDGLAHTISLVTGLGLGSSGLGVGANAGLTVNDNAELTVSAGQTLTVNAVGTLGVVRATDSSGNFTQFGHDGTLVGLGVVSGVACANGAGALVGTLNTSPVAGNPTKWVPFNDNGTVRYVPMW